MKKGELITKIMTAQVVTINLSHSLSHAEALFAKHKIRHIPVVNGQELIGMLSLTDLLRLSFMDNYGDDESSVDTAVYSMLSIEQVMVSNPVTVQSMQTIKEVAEILASREFHALPVIDGTKLAGIVTTTDLIKYLLEQY
jgi:CBS domain-containing protein